MEKYLALKASAGSGKTFALTVRYISLLLLGAKPSEILTLTFTNKAAAEMSQRVFNTLQTLGDDEAYLNEIIRVSNFTKEEVLGKKSLLIKLFINDSSSIFTIDKFVNKILREFCGYIGIGDDFKISNDDMEILSYKFLQSLDENSFKELVEFSLYEKKKFSSIFELFKILIEKNEKINSIEIDAKLINLIKNDILEKAFKIKEHILNCKAASASAIKAVSFTNFDELFSNTWIEKDTIYDYSYFKKCANEEINSLFLELKDSFLNYYKLRTSYSLNKIFKLYINFKEFKKSFNIEKNYFEFNDISNLVFELLNNKINKDFLYFRLDSNYNHILIDEFQDTSILQYKILKPLIDEVIAGDSEKFKTFFYVGDPKQSIYRFRGGKRELFDFVLSENSNIKLENLNTNYRSSKNIIDFVNNTFLSLPNYDYLAQKSIRKDGFVEVIEDSSLQSEDKFSAILNKINELLDNGINANDIAILCYTNSDVLGLFYYIKEKLPNLKIRTDMSSKLINQQNVKALINAIKYIYFKENIYKENFNALVGKNINSEFLIDINLNELSVEKVLYFVASYFDIIDENIIKLIEQSGIYFNIVDFIYEIDKLDISIENSENSGLQILTIFKSKGLEFHTTILIDRIKRKNHDKSSLLFDYENINLNNIYYKVSGYENFDLEYKKALEKEKNLNLDDEKNVLYVALTRAKNNLIVFKKEKSSVFDILDITPFKFGNLILSEVVQTKSINKKVTYEPLNLGKQDIKSSKDNNGVNVDILKSKYFGLATHYTLEMMSNFDEKALNHGLNLSKTKYFNYLDEFDFVSIKKIIQNLIKNDKFQNLIKDAQIVQEQALVYNEEIKVIDLLLYKDDRFIIVDYKTTTEFLSSHKTQIEYYKKAVCEIFNTKSVEGYLVYLKEHSVEFLEA
ncbi:recombinase RecB [Aliarcobacter cryaerophilus ATCC 43158]|uniref:DNA 3'-5' helicase n=3 Tax=Aliarcobacter cryaerophilus TaxID=28198 RepID=A0AAD0TYX5_9BACT|nr:RecB-like helicase [Aliarcobacter cryaerophilus]AYJ79407.1 AddAB recombination complex, helicase AddA [Aliarcobacter cryaerophilus ATCC 43158]QCZ23667.1 recombinase RecB [Aliarcobacter cryaerophilus ATCC 43158]